MTPQATGPRTGHKLHKFADVFLMLVAALQTVLIFSYSANVVPNIEQAVFSRGADLPRLTAGVFRFCHFIHNRAYALVVVLVIIIALWLAFFEHNYWDPRKRNVRTLIFAAITLSLMLLLTFILAATYPVIELLAQ